MVISTAATASWSADAPQPEGVRAGALGVVAHQAQAGRSALHGPQLQQREVLRLVDDHVAVGGGHALDAGADLVGQRAVAVGGQPGVDQVAVDAELHEERRGCAAS